MPLDRPPNDVGGTACGVTSNLSSVQGKTLVIRHRPGGRWASHTAQNPVAGCPRAPQASPCAALPAPPEARRAKPSADDTKSRCQHNLNCQEIDTVPWVRGDSARAPEPPEPKFDVQGSR